ncbi:MAG: hypothetical protein AAGM84_07670 [Pseudomonadota bacterium]
MKPNFALSLSVDGIVLLHRAAGGWLRVGAVPLTVDDMAGELAALRARAAELSDGAVTAKLIVPNDQIKYLTIDTGSVGTPARLDAARAALEGATPYEVDELAFDICEDGAQTHVAAVALETLEEAEAFARLHDFGPVSFVSVPGDAAFLGEPFFGEAQSVARLLDEGDMVEPDGIAVVVVGDVAPETPAAAPVTPPEAAAKPAPDPAPLAEPEPEPEVAQEPEPKPEPIAQVPAAPEPIAEKPQAEASDDLPQEQADTPPSTEEQAPKAEPEQEPAPDAAPGFASRRKAPTLGGARRDDTPPPAPVAVAKAPPAPVLADTSEQEAEPEPGAARAGGFLSRRKGQVAAGSGGGGFLSRRKAPKPQVAASVADAAQAKRAAEERRMTVFGARAPAGAEAVGGKPRFLGLILMAVLLVFLAGIAAWASVFLDSSVARLTPRAPAPEATVAAPPEVLPTAPEITPEPEGVAVAALTTGLTPEDEAVLDALQDPRPDPADVLPEPSVAEAEARYAVTGIWPLAPAAPEAGPLVELGDIYIASIDPLSPAQDAISLPARASLETDTPLPPRASPPPAGTQYARDAQGRIIPTPEGVQTPDGHMLFAGRPPVEPPSYPDRSETAPQAADDRAQLAAFRPQLRPTDLAERTERANLGGLTRDELAAIRPQLRPDTGKEAEEAAAEAAGTPPSQYAATESYRPSLRPRNFARIVERATPTPREETRTAAVAPRTVTPRIPSSASVAREATIRNAINLNRVNLIGVYGTPSARRALVRLSNGRYRKVKVGDRIDGGRVSAIGESELRYQKGNRNLVLKMPR